MLNADFYQTVSKQSPEVLKDMETALLQEVKDASIEQSTLRQMIAFIRSLINKNVRG